MARSMLEAENRCRRPSVATVLRVAAASIVIGFGAPGAGRAETQDSAPVTPAPPPAQGPDPASPAAPAPPPAQTTSARCIASAAIDEAEAFAAQRPGDVSFAVSEPGLLRSHHGAASFRSASLVKAMLLAADLRRHAAEDLELGAAARRRLDRMIRRSGNRAATETFRLVGRGALVAVAKQVGMQHFRVGTFWSSAEITAADQARLFGRLHSVLPRRSRPFARRLLRTIVPSQVWGGMPVARRLGYVTLAKSGWVRFGDDGWVVHQGLRLERDGCTLGIAVLTGRQPTMATGVATIRGVAERLLASAE